MLNIKNFIFHHFFELLITILMTTVTSTFMYILLNPAKYHRFDRLPGWAMVFIVVTSVGIYGEEHFNLQRLKLSGKGAVWAPIPGLVQVWLLILSTCLLLSSFIYAFHHTHIFASTYALFFSLPLLTYFLHIATVIRPLGKTAGFAPFFYHAASVYYFFLFLLHSNLPAGEREFWSWSTLVLTFSTLCMLAGAIVVVPPILRVLQGKEVMSQDFHQWIARLKISSK